MKHRKEHKPYAVKSKVRLKVQPIVEWRANREYSQAEAAKACGLSLPAYKNAEYGKFVQLVTASRVAKGINRPLMELEEQECLAE